MKIDGRCHCGSVTYEADVDPDKVMICHCTDCQALSGSAFRTVVLTLPNGFRLISGSPTTYVKTGESGAKRPQTFCPECGSPIYSASADGGPKIYSIRVGTIRQRRDLIPRAQIWCRSAQPWLENLAAVPQVETQSPAYGPGSPAGAPEPRLS